MTLFRVSRKNKGAKRAPILQCVVLLIAADLLFLHPAYCRAGEIPDEITTSPEVDEQLFLIRALEWQYDAWPSLDLPPEEFALTVTDLRTRALRLRQHAKDQRFDASIIAMYGDFIESLDTYLHFLSRIEDIEAQAVIQASEDGFQSGFKGGYAGGAAYAGMKGQDASTAEAAVAALLIGGATMAFDAWSQSEERDRAKAEAVAQAAQVVDDTIRTALYRAQSLSRTMADKHGWKRSEVGFELGTNRFERLNAMIAREDVEGLRNWIEAEARKRPRDPEVRLMRALLTLDGNEKTASDAVSTVVSECLKAVSLIPEHHVYDEYRCLYCMIAADFASMARDHEIQAGSDFRQGTAISEKAVELRKLALKYDPTDATGELREQLAWALLTNGRIDEALSVSHEITDHLQNFPGSCYQMASITSAAGQFDNSLQWLERAIDLGWIDIAILKNNPLLADLRSARPEAFQELTDVKWSWSIDWGIFNDDILLTNKSNFALTNVTLDFELKQDARTWKDSLRVSSISLRARRTPGRASCRCRADG